MNNVIEPYLKQMVNQVGIHNIMAISGGRIAFRETGLTLEVGKGYFVEIDLMPDDTYCVRRIFQVKNKRIIKGEVYGVYCDQVGDIAYHASCFVNISFGDDIK